MSERGSVSEWIGRLKDGDQSAAGELWQRYYARLIGLARRKLGELRRSAGDEDDVLISVFDGLCRGIAKGRFPRLDDRDDLWRILVALAERKAAGHARWELALKRGGGRVRDVSTPETTTDGTAAGDLQQIPDTEPTPEFAALLTERLDELLSPLTDGERRIAIDKMQGYTNREIAARLNTSLRSVERKLRIIRNTWQEEQAA